MEEHNRVWLYILYNHIDPFQWPCYVAKCCWFKETYWMGSSVVLCTHEHKCLSGICMFFPGEVSHSQGLMWNNFRMREHPEAHSRAHCISHTAVITHTPLFNHLLPLTMIKGDGNVKSDQVTGRHLTSLISVLSFVCQILSAYLWHDPCQPPGSVWQYWLISTPEILFKDITVIQ